MADSRASSALSFNDRDGSTSPSLSATPARSSYSASDRSFSTTSSITSYSDVSSDRRSSSFGAGATSKRRGYVRPQGAEFAESAKNRESVMSLGSIAHLQYYFARTGLLDGKGGRLAKQKKNGEYDIPQLRLSTIGPDGDFTSSPIDENEEEEWDTEPVMLPPTVSTYSHRTHHVPPPPDMKALKKDLVQALENALHALEAVEDGTNLDVGNESQGFREIQGLHILDVTTLAIRAARMYYTSHENPARLASIKSERMIRSELLSVMDILKRYATRKFTGGLKEEEKLGILVWVSDVSQMINTESKLEESERRERESWTWMSNDDDSIWKDREKEREWSFLNSLLLSSSSRCSTQTALPYIPKTLPPFSTSSSNLSREDPLLSTLADGRILILLHNAAVSVSKRHFGTITTHHSDIAKPYRRAENLRYWIKAAEIRFEIRMNLDVMGIVNGSEDSTVWQKFEEGLLKWCQGVRDEITRDWKGTPTGSGRSSPGINNPSQKTKSQDVHVVVVEGEVETGSALGHERNASLETITPKSYVAETQNDIAFNDTRQPST